MGVGNKSERVQIGSAEQYIQNMVTVLWPFLLNAVGTRLISMIIKLQHSKKMQKHYFNKTWTIWHLFCRYHFRRNFVNCGCSISNKMSLGLKGNETQQTFQKSIVIFAACSYRRYGNGQKHTTNLLVAGTFPFTSRAVLDAYYIS